MGPHTRTRILTSLPIKEARLCLESGALDHSAILTIENLRLQKLTRQKKNLAERSFDLRTSGLWAQHASTAPLCLLHPSRKGREKKKNPYRQCKKSQKIRND